jgi:hypothetical protein
MMAMMTSPSRLRLLGITVAVVLLCLMPLTAPIVTRSQDQGVVMNQIYAGGQSSQAPLRADYVELFNPGPAPVALDGWSVQYAADDGTTWRGSCCRHDEHGERQRRGPESSVIATALAPPNHSWEAWCRRAFVPRPH